MRLAISRDLNFAGQLRFPLGRRLMLSSFSGQTDRTPSFAARITGSPICYFLVQLAHRCTRENNNRVVSPSTFYLRLANAEEKTKRCRSSMRFAWAGEIPSICWQIQFLGSAWQQTRTVRLTFRENTCAIASANRWPDTAVDQSGLIGGLIIYEACFIHSLKLPEAPARSLWRDNVLINGG